MERWNAAIVLTRDGSPHRSCARRHAHGTNKAPVEARPPRSRTPRLAAGRGNPCPDDALAALPARDRRRGHHGRALARQRNWRKVAGESPVGRRSNQPLPPRVMGRHSRGCRLSVDRGAYGRGRLSYEKPEIQDAEAFQDAEGNIASTVMVRGKRTLRSRRTQPHARTLSRRDLGGLHAIPLS